MKIKIKICVKIIFMLSIICDYLWASSLTVLDETERKQPDTVVVCYNKDHVPWRGVTHWVAASFVNQLDISVFKPSKNFDERYGFFEETGQTLDDMRRMVFKDVVVQPSCYVSKKLDLLGRYDLTKSMPIDDKARHAMVEVATVLRGIASLQSITFYLGGFDPDRTVKWSDNVDKILGNQLCNDLGIRFIHLQNDRGEKIWDIAENIAQKMMLKTEYILGIDPPRVNVEERLIEYTVPRKLVFKRIHPN